MHLHQFKARWLALVTAALFLLAGALVANLSSSPDVAILPLVAGESVRLAVFRMSPDAVRLSFNFPRLLGQNRPELGDYAMTRGPGYIEFRSPGQPVVVKVQGPESTADYEALPASGYSNAYISRDFVVRENDGNPSRFVWPPINAMRPVLPRGQSVITLTVVQVGAALSGERVQAVIEPPLSFKSAMPGYGFLWWFFFWPVFAVPLAVYAAYLAWQTWASRVGQNEA